MPRTILSLILTAGFITLGCKKEEPPPPPPAPEAPPPVPAPAPAPAAAVPAGPPGSIKGVVEFTGAAPKMPELKRSADPFCAKTKMNDEYLISKGGKLANVAVRIKGDVPGTHAAPPAISLEQTQCMYRPRVSVAMKGQEMVIKNGDQTLHNVHTYNGAATWFNQAQVQGTAPITKKVADDAEVITFKCDVHPWMLAHVVVSSHPFAAVTGDDGAFELKNVPPGKYTVEAWHEKAGSKTMEIEVKSGAASEAKFAFAATDVK